MARKASAYGWWVAVVAGLAVLAVAILLGVVRPWADRGEAVAGPTAGPSPTPEPAPAAVLPTTGDAPAPTAGGVRAAIEDLIRQATLGEQVSAAVVDATTGDSLYRHRADAPAIPASTVKLVTAATVLATRGPTYQLATVAVAGPEPGEVVLVGGGDPTLAVDEHGFYPGAARLDQLAEQVRAALDGTPVTRVTVDADRFGGPVHGPWTADIPGSGYVGPITALMTDGGRVDPDPAQEQRPAERWDQPALAAGEAFAELLGLDPDAVTRVDAPEPPPPSATPSPAPGTELGRVSSPTILRLVEIMLSSSDNVVAEALARQVALARGQPATFQGAAAAMTGVLDKLGVAVGGSVLADGSGLSRHNQVTATLLTGLLSEAVAGERPELAGLFAALPVAGWSGTLADRFRSPQPPGTAPGAGYVRAKTGSLTGVSALAGLVLTADGRLLAFALLADEVPVGQTTAREALDRIAATLATCGCR